MTIHLTDLEAAALSTAAAKQLDLLRIVALLAPPVGGISEVADATASAMVKLNAALNRNEATELAAGRN